jgi:hypothetical protein
MRKQLLCKFLMYFFAFTMLLNVGVSFATSISNFQNEYVSFDNQTSSEEKSSLKKNQFIVDIEEQLTSESEEESNLSEDGDGSLGFNFKTSGALLFFWTAPSLRPTHQSFLLLPVPRYIFFRNIRI